jgi:DNA-binding transcriptional LysR family regulator
MNMTLHQLKTFIAVAEHGGLTAAAEKLHMTQPAVSIQVKLLEDYYGLPLLEVVGKKVYLTDVGRMLYQTAKATLAQLAELETEFSHIQGGMKGRLSVSVVSTAKYFVPHLLGQFHREYPDVEICLNVTNRAIVLERLQNNSDDLVILSQLPEKLPIIAEQFLEDELVIPAPPDHPFAKQHGIELSALKNEPFIIRERGSGTRMVMEQVFKKHHLNPRVVMEFGSSSAIKQAVIAGFGLSFLSKMSIENELLLNKLVILDIQKFPVRHYWYAVYLKGKKLTPIAKKFLQLLLST